MRRQVLMALAAATVACLVPSLALAQAYPSKPLRVIVPATPGGSSDIFARAMAKTMQASMGQPVIVEYKPGAATNIGTDFVAKSAPDGYTVLINAITLATNVTLYPNLPYNVLTDFAPVIEVAEIPNVITVLPNGGINSLQDLVRMAKAEPGKLNYGTPGEGSSGHLSAELLALKTGAKFTHVAYQGNAQATTDHLGGTLQVGFVNLPVGLSFVKAGKLKALAVTSAKRSPLLPDVPTVAEALNLPDYELSGWFGVVAPAKTPPEIVARLHAEFSKALKDPSVVEVITGAGADIVGGTSAQFGARIKRDTERLAPVLKASGATAK